MKTDHLRRKHRPLIGKLVKILRDRKGDPQDIDHRQILTSIAKIEVCGLEYGSESIGSKRWYPRCKQKLCPWCQSTEAKIITQILADQLSEFEGSPLLQFLRLSLGHGNVSGENLRQEIDKLIAVFKKVTNLREWKDEILRCGGFLHVEWRPQTDKRKAGWWPHMHIVCLTRTEKPRLEKVAEVIRRALRLDGSTSGDHYFNHQPVKHLGRTTSYTCSVSKRIPGYPTKKRPAWLLKEIPDRELVFFIEAVKHRQRVYQRGFDIDMLKASRKVGAK